MQQSEVLLLHGLGVFEEDFGEVGASGQTSAERVDSLDSLESEDYLINLI